MVDVTAVGIGDAACIDIYNADMHDNAPTCQFIKALCGYIYL